MTLWHQLLGRLRYRLNLMLVVLLSGAFAAILNAPVFNIKRLVGAKVRDVLIEQCWSRASLVLVAVFIAVFLSLVVASMFGILSPLLGIYLLFAIVLVGCIVLALELHHVTKQI
ncbi:MULTISPECIES: hypothetical protein [Pseudoalteromonas]|nr:MULTISPECIES: hypothetical protein [Pseudoalteromonas]MCO7199945.1 hypothetical protein [Pseudoalteromonas sp. OANN1]WPU30287.1 hypothetical protein SIO17_14350 [Pseudoalteromonas piscicida]